MTVSSKSAATAGADSLVRLLFFVASPSSSSSLPNDQCRNQVDKNQTMRRRKKKSSSLLSSPQRHRRESPKLLAAQASSFRLFTVCLFLLWDCRVARRDFVSLKTWELAKLGLVCREKVRPVSYEIMLSLKTLQSWIHSLRIKLLSWYRM